MVYRKGAPKPGEPGYWTPELLRRFEEQPRLPGETQYEKAVRLQKEREIAISPTTPPELVTQEESQRRIKQIREAQRQSKMRQFRRELIARRDMILEDLRQTSRLRGERGIQARQKLRELTQKIKERFQKEVSRIGDYTLKKLQEYKIDPSKLTPKGIEVVTPVAAVTAATKIPSPQELIAKEITKRDIDLTKRGKYDPIGDIARFEETIKKRKELEEKRQELAQKQQEQIQKSVDELNKAKTYEEQQTALRNLKQAGGSYRIVGENIEITTPEPREPKRVYGTLGTLAVGIAKDVKEGTRQWAKEVTTLVEKPVRKIPYEVRKEIAEKPPEYFKKLGKTLYVTTGIKKIGELMKKYPSPAEREPIQKFITGKVPVPTKFGDIRIQPAKPIMDIEKAYREEVRLGREPGRTRFFIEKLGVGYEEAGRGLGETYFQAKKGKLVSPWIGEKMPDYKYTPEARITGKVTRLVGQTQLYVAPTVGLAVISAPFVEAAGRRELKAYIKRHPLETAIAVTYIGGRLVVSGVRFGRYMKKPIITKLPKPKPRYKAIDVIEPIKYKERVIEKGRYVLRRDIPARKAEVITRWGKLLGKKPEVIKITKARTDTVFTPTDIKIERGVIKEGIFVSKRVTKIPEKGYYTWFEYSAEQKPLTLETFRKLPKLKRYELQQLAELKVGRPVSEKLVPQILGKDFQYTTGYIEAQKLAKLRLKGARIDIRTPTPGKTIYRGDITTIAKEITPEQLKEVGWRIYKTKTVMKDVTKPFVRARGTLPGIKGKTIVLPIKDLTPKETYILPKTLRQIQRAKISPKTLQVLEQAKITTIKVLPKPRPVIKLPKPTPVLESQVLAPRMVGGLGKGVSQYYGPTYAPPEEYTYVTDKGIIKDISATKIDTGLITEVKLKVIQKPKLKIEQIPKLIPVLETKQVTKLAQPQILETPQITKQITKQVLRQEQIQKIAEVLKIEQIERPKPTIPKIPQPLIPIKPQIGIAKALEKVKKIKPEKFTVFITKESKDVKTKTFKTKEEAVTFLKKRLLGTIAAGGFVKRDGKKLRFEELGVGGFGKFRRSKIDPFKLIQRKEKRLGRFGEVQEIQFFRKLRKGKKKGRKKDIFGI